MNIMTGGDELGQMMVEHPKIAQISFTGSAATGKKIMATGAATLKKVRTLPFPRARTAAGSVAQPALGSITSSELSAEGLP
eukprot:COSAG04_NODE_1001_length_8839_cov_3.422883_4_plen_81_part_00